MNMLAHRYKLLIILFLSSFLVFLGAALLWRDDKAGHAVVTDRGNNGNNPGNKNAVVHDGGGDADSETGTDGGFAALLARQPGPLPGSLSGTEVDGGVRVDADGNLILEPAVRDLFEYYLATLGEASLDGIRVRVAHYLNNHLPPRAARQGWALFNRYLDYREQLGDIPDPGLRADADTMKAAIRARHRLRREILGQETADAFFAMDEAYDSYMMTRLSVLEDDSLSEAQRARRLEQARAELPEPLQRVREETTRPMRVREKVEQMRAEGASEADIRAWREAELGAEAADRLEALEQRRRQWQQRYSAYREERLQMQFDGLAAPDRQAALQRLREKYFDAEEIRRAEALDRISEQESGERPDG